MIEKPLSIYGEKINFELLKKKSKNRFFFIGYNHSVGDGFKYFNNLLKKIKLKTIKHISVNWKEGWTGILNAHFWLKDEYDSYLGDVKKGGGAIHEHSHGLHLAVYLLKHLKIKKYSIDSDIFFKEKNKKHSYDVMSIIKITGNNINLILETDLLEDKPVK